MDGSEIQPQFDLDEVPLQHRSRIWMDALNEFFYDYDHYLPADIVTGRFTGGYVGDLRVASITSDAMSVYRNASHITRDALDAYFVLLPTKETIALGQRGRDVHLDGRQFALVSTSDRYSYVQPDTTTFNNLIIPGPLLRQIAPHADDLVAVASRDDPVSRVFRQLANALCVEYADMPAQAHALLSRQAVELLGLALDGADRISNATPIRMAHYRRIIRLIDQKYADPTLDVHMVAAKLRLSARYVQDILTSHNTTVGEKVRARRIHEACRLLKNGGKRVYIGEVAARVGFRDLAYFSRVFKAHTGCAPSQYAVTPETTEF